MDDPVQLDLDFHGPVGDGYDRWAWDHAEAVRRVARIWSLPLQRDVRIKLANIDGEFVGRLYLAELPPVLDRRHPLSLRLGNMVFSSAEIERCGVVEEGSSGPRQSSRTGREGDVCA